MRVRRRELAILSCLGWPHGRITALVLGEVLLIALTAGVLATAATFPLAAATGIHITTGHALLAIPVALALALAAAIIPAHHAVAAWPHTALQPPVRTAGRRPRRTRTLAGMAIANLTRVPARSLIAGLALAVGVAATTTLLLVTTHFHGRAQGTLLGDYVSLQVRGIDLAAAITTAALGILAITDALYLNIRQRAPELAALRATGWSDTELARLNTYEGAALAATAATLGATAGLSLVSWFTATITPATITTTALIAAAAAALATLAATIPAQLTRALPLTVHLVED